MKNENAGTEIKMIPPRHDYDPLDPATHAELMRRAHELRAEVMRELLLGFGRWLRDRVSALRAGLRTGKTA